jgi:AcrR family transcriptional regulator
LKTHSRPAHVKTEDCIVTNESGEKVGTILLGALTALAEKGYSNTTIGHIACASNVSRGLLHYYFKSKEDLVIQAASLGSSTLLNFAIDRLRHANSREHLADILIEVLRQTVEWHPTITAVLIELWGESRRSSQLRVAFESGFNEATQKLATLLAPYVSDRNPSDLHSAEFTSRILIGLYQGLVIQMISKPDLLNDVQFRTALRTLVISALRDVHN